MKISFKCSQCGKSQYVTPIHRPKTTSKARFYLDSNGRRIHSLFCYDCRIAYKRRLCGTGSRFESTDGRVSKCVKTEQRAAKFFSRLGFDVEQTKTGIGPDLVCSLGDMSWTVEVKPVAKNHNGRGYYVNWICPARRKDDLVAMVMPNGRVYIDSMRAHLKKCQKHGRRAVTDLVKAVGLG